MIRACYFKPSYAIFLVQRSERSQEMLHKILLFGLFQAVDWNRRHCLWSSFLAVQNLCCHSGKILSQEPCPLRRNYVHVFPWRHHGITINRADSRRDRVNGKQTEIDSYDAVHARRPERQTRRYAFPYEGQRDATDGQQQVKDGGQDESRWWRHLVAAESDSQGFA